MKRLLLLLSLLVATPAMADLGPADILLPGETYVDWYTARKAKSIEAYCAKWKNKCMVEITSDHLVVDDEYRVHRSNLIHAWTTNCMVLDQALEISFTSSTKEMTEQTEPLSSSSRT